MGTLQAQKRGWDEAMRLRVALNRLLKFEWADGGRCVFCLATQERSHGHYQECPFAGCHAVLHPEEVAK